MDISYQPNKELDEIRLEIQRLKAREKSLRAVLVSRSFGPAAENHCESVERRLREAFRHPRLFQRKAS